MMQDDVKQAAVNKVVVHLQRLGYVLKPSDLDLVKQAITTLRSTKAAARFMCASLGGSAKCLAPLPTVEVRMDADAKAPASRISSPQEIKLRGMKFPAMIKVSKVVAPRMPKATPRREAQRAAEAEVATAAKKAKKAAKPKARAEKGEPKKSATPKAQTTPAANVKAKPKSDGGAKAQPKPEPPPKEKPSCPPCPEPANAAPTGNAEANRLLKRIETLAPQVQRLDRKAQAAADRAVDKRVRKSKRKAAKASAEKLNDRAQEKQREIMDTERQLAEVAGNKAETLRQARAARKAKRETNRALASARQEDQKRKATMDEAKSVIAKVEQQMSDTAGKTAAKQKVAAPEATVDEGTALVNQLAAQLLQKR